MKIKVVLNPHEDYCGRYQFNFDNPQGFKDRFNIDGHFPKAKMRTSYNVKPGLEHPVIITNGGRSVELMTWGLIPFWSKSPNSTNLINIRSDTIEHKGWANKYIQFQRINIPASGFYEPKGPKTLKNREQYYFRLKNEEYFAFAGLYSEYKVPSGSIIKSYAIITTEPNELMAPIHSRMPAILDKKSEEEWLNPDNVEKDLLVKFLKPYPASKMEGWHVSDRVKNPKNDDPDLIKQVN